MAYTSNVPQANQQIASTQPTIQNNFGFLSTGIGTEHNFAAGGNGTDMYHLKASMPNYTGGIDPVALPAGTNGMYYVLGGIPKFYNGVTASPIAMGAVAAFVPFNGSFVILNNTTQNIPGVVGDVGGFISGYRADQPATTNETAVFFQNAATTAPSKTILPLVSNGTGVSIIYLWNGTNLAIRNQSGSTRTIKFFGWYYTTV